MAHHLYVLQALTLGLLEPRMRTPLDPYNQVGRQSPRDYSWLGGSG